MSIEFLDPTFETGETAFQPAPALASLNGATVAIISNGKKNTGPFFNAMAENLTQRHGVRDIVQIVKSNYSAPVEPAFLEEAEKWQAIISGIGD